MAKSLYLEDFKAAIAEIRSLRKPPETKGPKALHLLDLFSEIENPRTGRKVLIGQAARDSLSRIAQRALKQHEDLKDRVKESRVLAAIAEQLAIFLTEHDEPIDAKTADTMVAAAISVARETILKEMTHYIPCILSWESSRHYFVIGPVTFYQTKFFMIHLKEKFDSHLKSVHHLWAKGASATSPFEHLIKEKSDLNWPARRVKRHAEEFVQQAKSYLEGYRWIAEIKVKDFGEERSYEVAQLCVETALNILRLFIGADRAEKFRIGGTFRKERKGLRLSQYESGELYISHSSESEDEMLGPNWIENSIEGEAKPWVERAASLINGLRIGQRLPILYRRFIISLWWYGEAVSEPHNHAKIVRYATALEAFLGTPIARNADGAETDRLSDQVARRAGALCAHNEVEQLEKWKKDVKRFYNVRSRLVHGEYAPFDRKLANYVREGERLARQVLIEGLAWTLFLAQRDHTMNIAKISKYFDRVLPKCPLPEADRQS
jgi:hypothetical protein